MGRTCIQDHRPEHSLGNERWLNGCAQCEIKKLRKIAAHVPAVVYLKAKEAAGFGTRILADNGGAVPTSGDDGNVR